MTILLASASPRRVSLLQQLGLNCRQLPPDVDESVLADELGEQYVLRIAEQKALDIVTRYPQDVANAILLSADTCICCDRQILGKPADVAQAEEYLRLLSGRRHQVYSAVQVRYQERVKSLVNCSQVSMKPLSVEEIEAYCATGEPLGKAGAYAIQGLAGMFIQKIEGSYSAIVGLPLFETAELLRWAGLDLLSRQ